MKRWLAILMLLGSSSGCMLFDDVMDHDSPSWGTQATAEPPCGQAVRNVSAVQTAEPELLR